MTVDILSNKNLTTRFQILVEIAAYQPNIQQKNIAEKLGVTPQAVSDYIKQLSSDGLIISSGRSRYKVSAAGIDWMIRQLNQAKEYFNAVDKVIWNIRISPAITEVPIKKGQKIGLTMRQGLLTAVDDISGATGISVNDASKGDMIGVTDIRGIIDMQESEVTIVEIPGLQKGNINNINKSQMRKAVSGGKPLAYLGLEALVALRQIGIIPDINYAGAEAMVEAARKGLSPVIVCVDAELPGLIRLLDDNEVDYKITPVYHGRD